MGARVTAVVLSLDGADETALMVPGPTCGKVCLKAAYRPVEGFRVVFLWICVNACDQNAKTRVTKGLQ